MPIDPCVMERLVLVFGVLFVGLSAADPPQGLYTAEGVEFVGCFAHGESYHEEVLSFQISTSASCTERHPESCLTPATCIDACQNTSTNYIYIGLKYPGQCFCDSTLRGVNQTNSVDGTNCDGRCIVDKEFACGSGYIMLVYQLPGVPWLTTSVFTGTTNSEGHTTKDDVATTSNEADGMPQSTTSAALIAGAAAGGAAVLLVAGAVVGVCVWRKKSGQRQTDKPRSSLALQDVSRHPSHPPSASHSNPTVPPNPSNIDALYAKPDKKRKPKMSSPDDPSYQDVIPTGAQHQYATVSDNQPPNLMVRKDPNPYDSIQNDPQYAVVNKRPKYRPNVDVNPIYMGEGAEVSPKQETSDTLEMVDNVIYE